MNKNSTLNPIVKTLIVNKSAYTGLLICGLFLASTSASKAQVEQSNTQQPTEAERTKSSWVLKKSIKETDDSLNEIDGNRLPVDSQETVADIPTEQQQEQLASTEETATQTIAASAEVEQLQNIETEPNDNEEQATQIDSVNPEQEIVNDVIDYDVAKVEKIAEPAANLSQALRDNLADQYQRLSLRQENENAYSEALGEEYLSYGLLLQEAGRFDEARDMYADAMHIKKINNGINAIELRPVLRQLFNVNYQIGNTAELETNINKIIELERRYPNQRGLESYDLILKAGNYFIDLYQLEPFNSESSLVLLNKATKYLGFAIRQYGDYPMREAFMPYGEMALAHLYMSKLRLSSQQVERSFSGSNRAGIKDFEQVKSERFTNNSFSKTELYAKFYLQKATEEDNQEQIVIALLNLGDANLLFARKIAAAKYYELAWEKAQKLDPDNPIVLSMQNPVALPAFNYAYERGPVSRRGAQYASLGVVFDVSSGGRPTNVVATELNDERTKATNRAIRKVKRTIYRPMLDGGRMIGTDQHQDEVRVLVSKKS